MSKVRPTLQIKYHTETLEGQVIEKIKKTENASDYVRHFLVMLEGYDVLKQNKASSQEVIQFCTKCVQFFYLQNEIARHRLSQELKKSDELAEEEDIRFQKTLK